MAIYILLSIILFLVSILAIVFVYYLSNNENKKLPSYSSKKENSTFSINLNDKKIFFHSYEGNKDNIRDEVISHEIETFLEKVTSQSNTSEFIILLKSILNDKPLEKIKELTSKILNKKIEFSFAGEDGFQHLVLAKVKESNWSKKEIFGYASEIFLDKSINLSFDNNKIKTYQDFEIVNQMVEKVEEKNVNGFSTLVKISFNEDDFLTLKHMSLPKLFLLSFTKKLIELGYDAYFCNDYSIYIFELISRKREHNKLQAYWTKKIANIENEHFPSNSSLDLFKSIEVSAYQRKIIYQTVSPEILMQSFNKTFTFSEESTLELTLQKEEEFFIDLRRKLDSNELKLIPTEFRKVNNKRCIEIWIDLSLEELNYLGRMSTITKKYLFQYLIKESKKIALKKPNTEFLLPLEISFISEFQKGETKNFPKNLTVFFSCHKISGKEEELVKNYLSKNINLKFALHISKQYDFFFFLIKYLPLKLVFFDINYVKMLQINLEYDAFYGKMESLLKDNNVEVLLSK